MPFYTALPAPGVWDEPFIYPKSPYSSASMSRPLPTSMSPIARLRDQSLRLKSLCSHVIRHDDILGVDRLLDRRPLAGLDEPSFRLVLRESSPSVDDVRAAMFGVNGLLVRSSSDLDVPDSAPSSSLMALPMSPVRLLGPAAMPQDCIFLHDPLGSFAWLDSLFDDIDPEPSVDTPASWSEYADRCFPGHPLSTSPSPFLPSGLEGPPYSLLPDEPPTGWAARRLPLADLVSPFHAFSEFLADGAFALVPPAPALGFSFQCGDLFSVSVHRPTLTGVGYSDKSGDELLSDLGLVPGVSSATASSAWVFHGHFANLSRCPKAKSLVLRGHVHFTAFASETSYKEDAESALVKVRRRADTVEGLLAVELAPDFAAGPDSDGRLKWVLSEPPSELAARARGLASPLLRASSVPLDGSVPAPVTLSPLGDDASWEGGGRWTSWNQPALDGQLVVACSLLHAHVFVPDGFLADLESDPDKAASPA